MFDPFEYLVLRDKDGLLKTDFKRPLGKVSYHIPCHSRVQNIGQKTREVLEMVPDTTVNTVERCSGHDGTWGVKSEFFEMSMKIGKPVFQQMAAGRARLHQLRLRDRRPAHPAGHASEAGEPPREHPLTLLRMAYGLDDRRCTRRGTRALALNRHITEIA